MAKVKTKYVCQSCGHESPRWLGRCPNCGEWNSLVEEVAVRQPQKIIGLSAGEGPQVITAITAGSEVRRGTGIDELDRVLGGGVVPGSLVLVGGDPGIGKSTLLLQAANTFAQLFGPVLYVTGEESARQVKMRADRLGALSDNLYVVAETDLTAVESYAAVSAAPVLLIIDSIQTIYNPDLQSAPGSVSQVRECTGRLLRYAKTGNVPVFIVGHVTKEGTVAGPRVLEHMVDTVLYFEGERHNTYRILRAEKNRFGSTNEIGIFEMRDSGLVQVVNPSEIFLSERPYGVPGSVVVACMEGTRPVLVEIQALVSPTSFGPPRRMATGIDNNRLSLLLAVLEKRIGLHLQNQDAYLKVAGGIRIEEPAVDLGVVTAVASSFRDVPSDPGVCLVGEVGLSGEVRAVSRIEQRVREAQKLGFRTCVIPSRNTIRANDFSSLTLLSVDTVEDVLTAVLGGK